MYVCVCVCVCAQPPAGHVSVCRVRRPWAQTLPGFSAGSVVSHSSHDFASYRLSEPPVSYPTSPAHTYTPRQVWTGINPHTHNQTPTYSFNEEAVLFLTTTNCLSFYPFPPHSLFLLWTSFYWQEVAGLKQTEKDLHWGRSVFVCTASLKHRLILSLKSSPEEPEKINEFSPDFYCTVIQHLQGTDRSKGKYLKKKKK